MTALLTTDAPTTPLIPVSVLWNNATVSLTGWQIGPHLAVTPALRRAGQDSEDYRTPVFSGGWTVVHLPTGRCIPGGCGTCYACLHHALEFARRLAGSDIDWSAGRDTLAADPRVREVCRVQGVEFFMCTHPNHCADQLND
jgi:hypothetical protein